MRTEGKRLRAALAGAERGIGRAYPEELRRRAVEYARARQSGGAPTCAVAEELGVSRTALARWLEPRREQAIVPVVVEPVEREAKRDGGHGRLVVTHEDLHLRIEGMSVEDVVVLIERLW